MGPLTEFVRSLPITDVHEHHLPEVFLNRDVGLLDLLHQSYAGWTQARPYPLPSEAREEDPMLASRGEGSWEEVARFVEGSGSSTFVRNLVCALIELYDLDPSGITAENWRDVDAEVRRRHRDPDWPSEVMRRARTTHIITDAYSNPLLDARPALGASYRSVMRINGFAMGFHPDRADHNGNSAFSLAAQLGRRLDHFDDFVDFLDHAVETMADRGQVAIKNALAYDRDLCFDAPNEDLARSAWGQFDPPPEAQKAFGDFVVDRFCRLAAEQDIPVQMHLGSALIRGSHPLNVADLIERHPATRFLLMHFAYPWSVDLLGLAFVYRNIWLDLTWSFLLSPTHFKRALHEAIEVLPNEARMMLGGDNWHAEESYGTFELARRLIGEVLDEKVEAGYFAQRDAERLARKVCSENANEFFQLDAV